MYRKKISLRITQTWDIFFLLNFRYVEDVSALSHLSKKLEIPRRLFGRKQTNKIFRVEKVEFNIFSYFLAENVKSVEFNIKNNVEMV